jgi:hypothetical protein
MSKAWKDEKAFTFDGTMVMYFTCLKPTKKVTFHSKELNLTFVEFRSFNHDGINMSNVFDYDIETGKDFVIGNLNNDCKPNATYSLKLSFSGKILDKLSGFYKSSYQDINNTKI